MVAFISLFIVIILSILITRIATVALTHTGLSREAARFQARSAFTGVGFTTEEAESVVNHPVRRKIVLLLMLLGSAGFVTAMASLILTFVNVQNQSSFFLHIILMALCLAALCIVASSRWLDRYLSRLISWALNRYTTLSVRDYASLLNLSGGYRVTEMRVDEEDWMANRKIGDLKFREEGILILAIKRDDGTYRGAPKGPTKILPGDTLILYGRSELLEKLGQRPKGSYGDREHNDAVSIQRRISEKEKREDKSEQPETSSAS